LLVWRFSLAQGVYVGLQGVAYACQTWFYTAARSSLLWFPVFTLLGRLAALPLQGWRYWLRQAGVTLLLIASALAMLLWSHRYLTSAWAG
ncbi:MAG: hypothetical protein LBR33_02685, partial [Propionibacteriaceae bacterium]|nr:hypothetical protein [Propionibacteriaceae bacterium]